MTYRGTAHSRGYTSKWAKYSKAYRRANPWCVMCLPKLTPAQCVDHIVPATEADDPTFYDSNNHQGLCHTCHNQKTAIEDGGFGHKKGKMITIGLDGWPIEDTHTETKTP